jgi:hypothetical protein
VVQEVNVGSACLMYAEMQACISAHYEIDLNIGFITDIYIYIYMSRYDY